MDGDLSPPEADRPVAETWLARDDIYNDSSWQSWVYDVVIINFCLFLSRLCWPNCGGAPFGFALAGNRLAGPAAETASRSRTARRRGGFNFVLALDTGIDFDCKAGNFYTAYQHGKIVGTAGREPMVAGGWCA